MHIKYKPIDEADRENMLANDMYAFGAELADAERYVQNSPPNSFRGLYADGQLVSQMQILPLSVMTGGANAAVGGIASVATPPEHRRRGYVEQMLRAACNEMRERDLALCMLYPFKASFYHRFGWATCQERRLYTATPAHFASFLKHGRGQFTPAGEAEIDELNSIYTTALRGRFGPLVRDAAWWRLQVLSDSKKPYRVSVWRDESGRGRAYLSYRLEPRADGRGLVVREVVALDSEARSQLFVFFANHEAQAKEISFRAPADAPVNMLLPDPIPCQVEPYFMLRLLDVGKALTQYRYHRTASGTLTIAVTDSWLNDNTGVYQLDVANGSATVTRQVQSSAADLVIDVAVLAQLYARYLRPQTAAAFGLLDVRNRAALPLADAMFAGLAPFSSDFF